MIIFNRADLIIVAVAFGLVALVVYGLGVFTGIQTQQRRTRPTLHIGDMPHHPETLSGDLTPHEVDALDAIAARLPRRRLRLPLRGRS